jgi:hypothetical protein
MDSSEAGLRVELELEEDEKDSAEQSTFAVQVMLESFQW